MEFREIRQRLEAAKNVRIQREAAENRVPREGLRRKLRESFARQSARPLREDSQGAAPVPPPSERRPNSR
jgi:hypothetical protein